MEAVLPEKLVRDKIPAIVDFSDGSCDFRRAEPSEMMTLLRAKLLEEVDEFLESQDVAELADIIEVVFALVDRLGCSRESFEEMRVQKARSRGVFDQGFVLLREG
ncbi:nucleoside triphosphate pyrophosphohydrolase [Plantactinospora mayteni]|uniref:Phosphoribosyl-ATP pyrophosphohydrolase n=1 Tax=Plantactinospora mayteni TaxID=566021 RepID=A0ABQ4EIJ2_9ACTN|nr:nucleoside triphosphate pyrophosphohydrolase [Plantactinospora mayteni]GIG94558.1 phosphoribosyl-ATP pyrophosphohydrolase [Plantactinospora mayteni]